MDFLNFIQWLLERKNEHQINKSEIVDYLNQNVFINNNVKTYQEARTRINDIISKF